MKTKHNTKTKRLASITSESEELISAGPVGGLLPHKTVTLQSGAQWLDAWEIPQADFNVVTRDAQYNDSQNWKLNLVPFTTGNLPVYTVVQVSSGRFLDAHEIPQLGYRVVTRPQQNNDTQRWRFYDDGSGSVTIQQLSSGRFLQATQDGDFQVVTAPDQYHGDTAWRVGAPF
jgi:Ricin-type beta-trefoil lectin domain-like